jgi:DNA repair exonuclease SbcCD nuclease subunit
MKLAIIGDCHIAQSNGSVIFQKNFKQFCDLVLFPYLLKNKITQVLQTGDLFDNRRATNTEALDNSKSCFFDVMQSNNIKFDMILGNHDIFLRNSLEINTPELVLAEYDNITIHKKFTTVKFDNITVDFLSWICDENREATFEFVKNSNSDYCFAHLELAGFKMSKYYVAEHGDDPNLFNKYKQVWSGHYHQKNSGGNILYLGNPTQDDWSSVDEVKGFHVFDTETNKMEFIENPYNLYERIVYDDSKNQTNLKRIFKDKFVRVIIENVNDNELFERYVKDIWEQSPYDVKIIENKVANFNVDSNITLEELDSSTFSVVPFLTQYTIKSNTNLTLYQQEFARETFKKLYNNSREVL